MNFTLKISCDNAAFGGDGDDNLQEITRILLNLKNQFQQLYDVDLVGLELPLRDSNGNKVGVAKFTKN